MVCTLEALSPNDLPTVYKTYRTAFADYVRDVSQVSKAAFANRMIKTRVDWSAYPTLNWILSLAVHRSFRRQGIGTALIAHLKTRVQVSSTHILNVEHTYRAMVEFLQAVGFEFAFNQFEMALDLA